MTGRRLRSLGVVPLAVAGAALLGVTSTMTSSLAVAARTVTAEAVLLDSESWIMGGSGTPIPPPSYLDAVTDRFINPPGGAFFTGQPLFPVNAQNALFTPEGLYPITGIKVLPLDPSVDQGISILNSTINQQVADHNDLVVFGYSQSAVISSLEMRNLLALPPADQPGADALKFVLVGNESNPDGGLLARFGDPSLPHLTMPSLGLTFSGATPADTPWETAIYTQEYDGFADFPKYPINFLSDLNAVAGIEFVHGTYPELTDAQMATAVPVPTTGDYTGSLANTTYWMIPTQNLPLLDPVRDIPVVGTPLANLLQPVLEPLVNVGYGDPDFGWSTTGANVSTPFGLFPEPDQLLRALEQSVAGIPTGFEDAINGGLGPLSNPLDLLGGGGGTSPLELLSSDPLGALTNIVNTLTNVAATAYAPLLPTADIVNALLTSIPMYDVNLFAQFLTDGDLLNAVGMPIAADVGLATVAGGVEFLVVLDAAQTIVGDLTSLLPF